MTSRSGITLIFVLWLAVLGWSLIYPSQMDAQTEGNDAVYNASNAVTFSPSFIDASQFLNPLTQGRDLCDTIFGIFTNKWGVASYPAAGAVIDARGISGTSNLKCTHGTPWTEGSTTVTAPSIILLPATGGATPNPIIIPNSSPWILPSNTHLIGEGDGIPTYSSGTLISTPGTTIQAASGFSGTMIQFGSSSPVCPSTGCSGISVENLTLDGQGPLGQTVNGIANAYSQDGSYVDHVSLYQILGTRLAVSGTASNSGPYSNLTFDTGGDSRHVVNYMRQH